MRLPGSPHLHDLGLFAATVAVAAWQDWAATDLVWSLWISSLLVGYAFIVVVLFVGNDPPAPGDEETAPGIVAAALGDDGRALGRVVGLLGALVALGFFTFHFGIFHYVHSVFLNEFFPLVDPSEGLLEGSGGPVWWAHVIVTAVERYWPFLVATVLSRRADFLASVQADPDRDTTLGRPYLNVVRMHLLIFVFAGLEMAGLRGYAVYPVLFFYFFPLGALKAMVTGGEPANA